MLYTNFDSTEIQKTYQHLVKNIVEYYKLPKIEINFDADEDATAIASYNPYKKKIVVNEKFLDFSKIPDGQYKDYQFVELLHAAFHEPRHY